MLAVLHPSPRTSQLGSWWCYDARAWERWQGGGGIAEVKTSGSSLETDSDGVIVAPCMGRPLRIMYPGACYHVTARGNERRPIYRDDNDRQRFLHRLGEVVGRYRLILHPFVLMRNHLLLETPEANLSRALRQLNGVYTQDFNRGSSRCRRAQSRTSIGRRKHPAA